MFQLLHFLPVALVLEEVERQVCEEEVVCEEQEVVRLALQAQREDRVLGEREEGV